MARTLRYEKTVELVLVSCPDCAVDYGIPAEMNEQLLKKCQHGSTCCPNGHKWHYLGTPLEDQLKAARARATHEADQRLAAERSAAAFKGQATKLRTRAANGVCPCCHRQFANVRRHMTSKHPGFAEPAAVDSLAGTRPEG